MLVPGPSSRRHLVKTIAGDVWAVSRDSAPRSDMPRNRDDLSCLVLVKSLLRLTWLLPTN
jgi:hypothetical protein